MLMQAGCDELGRRHQEPLRQWRRPQVDLNERPRGLPCDVKNSSCSEWTEYFSNDLWKGDASCNWCTWWKFHREWFSKENERSIINFNLNSTMSWISPSISHFPDSPPSLLMCTKIRSPSLHHPCNLHRVDSSQQKWVQHIAFLHLPLAASRLSLLFGWIPPSSS